MLEETFALGRLALREARSRRTSVLRARSKSAAAIGALLRLTFAVSSSVAFVTTSAAARAGEAPSRDRAQTSHTMTSTGAATPKATAGTPAPPLLEEARPPMARVAGPEGAPPNTAGSPRGAGVADGGDIDAAQTKAAEANAADGAPLDWRAPAACPTRADVLWHVTNLAESEALRWKRFERIRARVERQGSGWVLALEFVASGGIRRRTMSSAHCADLAEAAAVAIVLALRSDVAASDEWKALSASTDTRASSSESTPELGPPPKPPEQELREPGAADASGERVPLTLAAEAEAAIDPNTLGAAAFGAAAGVRLGLGRASTTVYGAAFPSATTELGAAQSVALALWTGGLRGCYRWGRGFDACAMMELGQISAEGVGLSRASEVRDLWATPGLSVAFTATPFDGWGITTRLSAFHPLVRGRYRVDEGETVHRLPAVGIRAALGIHVPFL